MLPDSGHYTALGLSFLIHAMGLEIPVLLTLERLREHPEQGDVDGKSTGVRPALRL